MVEGGTPCVADANPWSGAIPTGFVWHSNFSPSNTLPLAVAALGPQEIRFYPPRDFQDLKDYSPVPVVGIKIFESHASGGHSIPYFGLEVACGPGAGAYVPSQNGQRVSGRVELNYRKVTDRIYEIY